MTTPVARRSTARDAPDERLRLLSKVPEVTLYFWVIKLLCTTVGQSAADYLGRSLGLGLTYASYLMAGLLVIALAVQFSVRRYVPTVYWVVVVLLSVVGALLTDNLTDEVGLPLPISAALLLLLLAGTFATWFAVEKTLSIHTICTPRREVFYWLTILLTFALGTAAGDLVEEELSHGYLLTSAVIGAVLVAVVLVWWKLGLHPVVAFWVGYVLTRPLGASIGELTAQSPSHGGLGLGTTETSLLFLTGILALVSYLSVTRRDVTEGSTFSSS
jgi:uncharacterized membrane-anchored protein